MGTTTKSNSKFSFQAEYTMMIKLTSAFLLMLLPIAQAAHVPDKTWWVCPRQNCPQGNVVIEDTIHDGKCKCNCGLLMQEYDFHDDAKKRAKLLSDRSNASGSSGSDHSSNWARSSRRSQGSSSSRSSFRGSDNG